MKIINMAIPVLFIIGLITTFILMMASAQGSDKKEKEKVVSFLGKSVLLGADTAIITDYSRLRGTYTLSNGNEIAIELAEKIVIK